MSSYFGSSTLEHAARAAEEMPKAFSDMGSDRDHTARIDRRHDTRQNPTASRTPQTGEIMSEQRAT